MTLDTAFLAALDPAVAGRYRALAELPAELARLVAEAGVTDGEQLAADIALRVDPELDPARALAGVRAADLALATACARGDRAAIERFEAELFGEVDLAFTRFRNAAITRDELRQAIRARLFVADGAAPRIASYQGRGELRAWVKMTTVRYLLDVVRAESARPERAAGDDQLADVATAGDDPEVAFLKQQYRVQFLAAFAAAVAGLPPRDRNILRHRYVDALEVNELATIYGLHRVSMSRTLSRIRDDILAAVRRGLLAAGTGELDSVMALIASQLELSLSGLLRR